ncbi:superinfection immunity protein [Calidifontibacter terrae]
MSMNDGYYTQPIEGRTHNPTSPIPQQPYYPEPVQSYAPGGYAPQGYSSQQPYAPAFQPGYAQPQSYFMTTAPPASGGLIAVAWIVALFSGLYMVPWAVAVTRNKSDQATIGLLNFFLGWSVIGWIIALVMACGTERSRHTVVVNQFNGPPNYYR